MVTAAFNHFKNEGGGHIAVISSIAGTKGLGIAPAYSATKRFQNTYIEALAQLSRMQHLNIHFTDIRPGFVATDLLKSGKFPMLMQANQVAKSIVHALNRKKRVIVIDGRYRVVVFFWRMIPRWLQGFRVERERQRLLQQEQDDQALQRGQRIRAFEHQYQTGRGALLRRVLPQPVRRRQPRQRRRAVVHQGWAKFT